MPADPCGMKDLDVSMSSHNDSFVASGSSSKEGPPAMKAGGQITTVQVIEKVGGRDRDRTGDPLLAKQTGAKH
jgi:hypothetical protein